MTTDFIKQQQELDEELAQAIQDFYFSKGAVINKESWEETIFMVKQYRGRLITNTGEELLRRVEGDVLEADVYYKEDCRVVDIDTIKQHIVNVTGVDE